VVKNNKKRLTTQTCILEQFQLHKSTRSVRLHDVSI